MELKHTGVRHTLSDSVVLIVPYGIETSYWDYMDGQRIQV